MPINNGCVQMHLIFRFYLEKLHKEIRPNRILTPRSTQFEELKNNATRFFADNVGI